MIKDNDFIHLPELYLTLESLKKHIKQHYNLNITNMANENKHSGYNDEQMAMTQLDIIHRYSVKLETMISEGAYLEEWVKMKLSRVELMIASVKHALEGVEKFEDGGELARKQLLHISKYSAKLIEMLKEGSILMSWMESNIAICADYMDGIYHHLDYKMGNRAKQMEYRNGGGVGELGDKKSHRELGKINGKKLSYYTYETPKVKIAWKGNIQQGYYKSANEALEKIFEWSKDEASLYDYSIITPDGTYNLSNPEWYSNGGGVDMAERGKRIYTDWKGKKSNETWGKYNLYDKYNNILDLCADLVDFLRKTKEQLGEDYYISAKRDLLSAINNESIGYFDNGVLKFKAGGGIPNMYGGKTAEQVWDSWTESQRKHFCYDHELMDNVSWKTLKMSSEQLKRDNWGKEFGDRTSWDWIKNVLQEHIEEGQYKNGGGVDMANKFPTTKDGWEKFMDEKFAEFKKVETEYMAKYNPHWNYKYEAGFWRADKDGKPVEITLKEGGSRFPYTLDGFLRHIEELKSKIEYRNGGGVGKKIVYEVFDNRLDYSKIKTFKKLKDAYLFCKNKIDNEKNKIKKEELYEALSIDAVDGGDSDIFLWYEAPKRKEYADGGGIGDDDDYAENVSNQEIEGFIDYFMDAYNILSSYGIYSKDEDDIGEREEEIIENERDMIRRAILEYFDELQERREKNYTWGGGDTLDRERVKIIYDSNFKKGGLVDGGGIDSYGDMNPEQVWNNWSSAQRYHFIYDHMKESTPITQEELSKKAYSFLPANVKQELHEHIHMGKYNAGGGVEEMREIEYADGGTVGTGKNAKALMRMDNDIWDKLNIDSGSQLYSDEKLQKKYAEELSKGLEKMGFETYTLKAGDILTDWNYHALRSAMTFMGYFGEIEKNNQLEYKRETKKLGLSYYGLTPEIFTK